MMRRVAHAESAEKYNAAVNELENSEVIKAFTV